jgi:hypothetical protein
MWECEHVQLLVGARPTISVYLSLSLSLSLSQLLAFGFWLLVQDVDGCSLECVSVCLPVCPPAVPASCRNDRSLVESAYMATVW